MNRNTGIIIIVVIAVLLVGVLAAFMMRAPTSTTASQTLMVIDNNAPDHWAHSVAVIENVTKKDGSITNVYVESWKEPSTGRSVINLTQELGYDNEALPAGTTFRMKMWTEPYSANTTGEVNMNLGLNGGDENHIDNEATRFDVIASHILYQLPADITQGKTDITLDPAKGAAFLEGMNTIYVEVIVTVNADGSVTITPVTQPVLCELIAGIS
ncbi:MAG: hypothetical protein KKF16_00090 [Euryarchaeota archaeon]|nr:hypothetical protein [Euryarchaeota archaeon]MBU4607794.1 hypothetical protein [Euryarchaeota archaeon]MBV1755169.1 hypothetical protein [Methanobacterium sp.]